MYRIIITEVRLTEFTYIHNYICDWICKKGSYMCTTLAHRFYQNSVDTLLDYPCVMFCGQQFTSLLFLRMLSETCQTSMDAWLAVVSAGCSTKASRLKGLTQSCSTDLTTL